MPLYNPTGGSGSGGLLFQTSFTEQTTDTSITGTTFGTFGSLSVTITTSGNSNVVVQFQSSLSNNTNNQQVYARLQVDGVTKRSGGMAASGSGNPGSVVLIYQMTGLSAGSHTFTIQWRASSSGSIAQCRPVTVPDGESASLMLQEIST